ncbi:TetR/AcrR family transcriptional regulator [Saccharopolyspora erythraea]|uniref:TetR/AcrR family transcriptional regulator n=1 Tax=Saccharopolyspora erythraea TaxID=1836 RepID=UPI001BAE53EC|nr:TetR/AcrR family transcriptional regulator [Saccharopolyspora erythraea]QUH03088.1 TetR/AcrR family transcriptional regulator [Saccharopolyspora erythraea]
MSSKRPSGTRGPSGSRRRAELLAIAADLFARRGFQATTVRDIADAAGILSGSLYHHFDSKETMVDEILRDFLDSQRRAQERVLAGTGDARDRVAGLVRQSFRTVHRHRAAVVILQNESNHLATSGRFAYLRAAAGDFERTWTRVLREGQRAGVLRADLNVKLAYRFIRDAVWTSVHWYNPRGRLTLTAIAEQYVSILRDGIAVADTRR